MNTNVIAKIAEGVLMASVVGGVLYGMYHFFGFWFMVIYSIVMVIAIALIAIDIRKAVEMDYPDEYNFDDIV